MSENIGILFVYGPQGKSVHIMDIDLIESIPNIRKPSKYSIHYSLTHV